MAKAADLVVQCLESEGVEYVFGIPGGLDYANPDFVKYAESYGATGYRIESADSLIPLLDHCISNPGVHVIDCPVDYNDNDRILNIDIRERSAAV